MFLDFRNGFDAFVDGVCCMYEKERRCTGPVESQCHGAYTQQNLPVSVPDVVTWAVFISKSCSSAGADGDVRPSWGWLLLLAVAGVFHSILFIVFVAFSSHSQPAMVQFVFVSHSQPAMVQFVFVSCNGSVCVCFSLTACNGSVCVCFSLTVCNGSVCVCFLQWFSLCLFLGFLDDWVFLCI